MQVPQYLYQCPNPTTNLNKMRLNSELCDVTIKVNEKTIRAHKVVLAAGLNYFHSMFLHSFREKNEDVISIKHVDERSMEALVSFAYTGKILLTNSNALSLLEDANYLNEVGIRDACIKFLKSHLSPEEAGQALQCARAIDSPSLEQVARQKILSHFHVFSQTIEYFKLDLSQLRILLSDDKLHSVDLREILFQGIMNWIMYDAENRRIHVHELLDFIKATNVRADYVMDYLCKIVTDNDYEYIEKSIMSFYRSKTNNKIGLRTAELGQTLVIANRFGKSSIQVQFYDLHQRKWSKSLKIVNEVEYFEGSGVILNGQLYFVKYVPALNETEALLEAIDFNGKNATVLAQSIPRLCSVCAHDVYLYACGGFNTPSVGCNVYSRQILEFDSEASVPLDYSALAPMKTERIAAATVFYQNCLYVLGGCNGRGGVNSVEKYNFETREWSEVEAMREPRWNFAVAVLNGKLYACGGPSSCSVEAYEPLENAWIRLADMNRARWDFIVVALEGKLLAIGGDDEATVEVYYTETDKWLLDHELSSGLEIRKPTGGLIQSSGFSNVLSHF